MKGVHRMKNAELVQILAELEKAKVTKLDEKDPKMIAMVADVQKKQDEILKLKQIDYEDLQVVIQL
jgi:hypothetical protein